MDPPTPLEKVVKKNEKLKMQIHIPKYGWYPTKDHYLQLDG